MGPYLHREPALHQRMQLRHHPHPVPCAGQQPSGHATSGCCWLPAWEMGSALLASPLLWRRWTATGDKKAFLTCITFRRCMLDPKPCPACGVQSQLFLTLPPCRGIMRWEICFNLSVLRMLSYALDLHWRRRLALPGQRGTSRRGQPEPVAKGDHAGQAGPSTPKAVCPAGPPEAAALWRQQAPLPSEREYGLLPYLAHVLYAPLYLAGPIITFQDFSWQLRQQRPPSAGTVGLAAGASHGA